MRIVMIALGLGLVASLVGCKKEEPTSTAPPPSSPASAKPSPAPAAPDKSANQGTANKANESSGMGHHGPAIELGEAQVDKFTVRASRDEAEIKPGGDAPVDVWINGGTGEGVVAVRFWIGTQDASGSVKAKADIESGKWHTHVELPSPMPADSKLWVEIEESGGKKSVASFDLRA